MRSVIANCTNSAVCILENSDDFLGTSDAPRSRVMFVTERLGFELTMKRIDRWLVTAGLDPVSLKAKMRAAALHGADAKLSGGKPLAGEEDQRVGLPPMREAS